MNVPKQWRLRAQTPAGEPSFVTVVARDDNHIGLYYNTGPITLTPLQTQRLRALLADAMAETLRGHRD